MTTKSAIATQSTTILGYSKSDINKIIFILCAGFSILMGLYWMQATILHLQGEDIYTKDFPQEYVLARSFLVGENPYQSLQFLYEEYVPQSVPSLIYSKTSTTEDEIRPMPHPPTIGALVWPLGFLSYSDAVVVWYGIELLLLFISVYLNLSIHKYGTSGYNEFDRISRKFIYIAGGTRFWIALGTTIVLFAWQPILLDIAIGQIEIVMLFFLSVSLFMATRYVSCDSCKHFNMPHYVCLRKHRTTSQLIISGLSFGTAICIKPIILLIVVTFLLRKEWIILISSVSTIISLFGIATIRFGLNPVIYYFTNVVPYYSKLYQGNERNLSVLSIPFIITQNTIIQAQLLFWLSFCILLFTYIFHNKARNYAQQFSASLISSVLISPISWIYYFSLFVIPILTLPFRNLSLRHYAQYGFLAIPLLMGFSDFLSLTPQFPISYIVLDSAPILIFLIATNTITKEFLP